MSNRQVLRDIVTLSGKLKPRDGNFVNKVFIAAREMLADEPADDQRKDGLTNHERMLRNKAAREERLHLKKYPATPLSSPPLNDGQPQLNRHDAVITAVCEGT